MKPVLMEILRDQPDDFRRRSTVREYLQARILLALQDAGAFADWAFVGGTALRFLFQLPRYSEGLDFSLTTPEGNARFEKHMQAVGRDLALEGYDLEIRSRPRRPVASAAVKVRGLLYELGLSPHPDEVLMIKVEIDTRPPRGARTTTRLVHRFVLLNLLHHDRSSLLAGKLHALLTRRYTKGRDLYDLGWYLADPTWPAPNLVQLNNALRQSGWDAPIVTPATWRGLIRDKLNTIDWREALRDVSPFLEREQDKDLVSRDVLLPLLADP